MSAAGISTEQVKAFLEAYASAFQRLDRDAVADRYAYPAHVVTYDAGVRLLAVPTREAWTAVIERILAVVQDRPVLLSEVPEPSTFIAETSVPHVSLPNLSSLSLAALSQRYDILAEAGHGMCAGWL